MRPFHAEVEGLDTPQILGQLVYGSSRASSSKLCILKLQLSNQYLLHIFHGEFFFTIPEMCHIWCKNPGSNFGGASGCPGSIETVDPFIPPREGDRACTNRFCSHILQGFRLASLCFRKQLPAAMHGACHLDVERDPQGLGI